MEERVAKKKAAPVYAICGQCGEDIDMPKLQEAMKADRTYIHYCGRVLHWGGSESEVRPDSPNDADSDITSKSSNPTAGDA